MSLRRRVTPAVVAGAFLALATAGGSAPAHADTGTICVALVVDFAALGGGVDSTCATVHKGATGYDVLEAGGHTFSICSNGVLGGIDGKPSDGCTEKNDGVHYWSYWHRAPGSSSWTYSNEGAGTSQPEARSTEGWRWMKSPPADVPYDQICRSTTSPTPTPSPSPSKLATTIARARSFTPSPSRRPADVAVAPTSTSTATTKHPLRHHVTDPPRPTTSVAALRETASPSAAAATGGTTSGATPRADASNSGRLAALGAAAVVVSALGLAGWRRARRSRTDP
jgi:hypothetical protein